MKKTLLMLACFATFFAAQAQIPATGLANQWKLNGNFLNSVTGGISLTQPSLYVCNDDNFDPLYFQVFSQDDFVPGRATFDSTGYRIANRSFPDFLTCYTVANGYTYEYVGTQHTNIFTEADIDYNTKARTISLWAKRFRPTNNQVQDFLFYIGTQGNNEAFSLVTYLDTAYLTTRGPQAKAAIGFDTLWHNYTATFNNDTLKLYVDGVLGGTTLAPGASTGISKLLFGPESSVINIDNVLTYNRAITPDEVLQIAQYSPTVSGVNESYSLLKDIYVFPNPTYNIINIQTDAIIEAIAIYNLQGQNVMNVTTNTKQLDLTSVAEGAYIIQINTKESIARRTIIKQ